MQKFGADSGAVSDFVNPILAPSGLTDIRSFSVRAPVNTVKTIVSASG